MTIGITIDMMDKIHALAGEAGRAIMEIYSTDFAVDEKADHSPVTEADNVAEDIITRGILETVTDAFPVVGEEAFARGDQFDISGGTFWLVDALDGTKSFVERSGEFTVNIALVDKGRPQLGVVHLPVANHTYLGSPHGSFAQTDAGGPRAIHCRPVPADGMVAMVSRHHRSDALEDFLKDYKIKEENSAGSSLKFCWVASGRADIYPRMGRTMEWDTAAGHAVVRFAGGSVRNLDGSEFLYGKPGFENPSFVARGIDTLPR